MKAFELITKKQVLHALRHSHKKPSRAPYIKTVSLKEAKKLQKDFHRNFPGFQQILGETK